MENMDLGKKFWGVECGGFIVAQRPPCAKARSAVW